MVGSMSSDLGQGCAQLATALDTQDALEARPERLRALVQVPACLLATLAEVYAVHVQEVH